MLQSETTSRKVSPLRRKQTMAGLASAPRSSPQHWELPSSRDNGFLFLLISIALTVRSQDAELKDQYLNVGARYRNGYSCA